MFARKRPIFSSWGNSMPNVPSGLRLNDTAYCGPERSTAVIGSPSGSVAFVRTFAVPPEMPCAVQTSNAIGEAIGA